MLELDEADDCLERVPCTRRCTTLVKGGLFGALSLPVPRFMFATFGLVAREVLLRTRTLALLGSITDQKDLRDQLSRQSVGFFIHTNSPSEQLFGP